jgi:hypothetical protein
LGATMKSSVSGAKAPVIDMHAHPEIPACLIVPDRLDLDLIGSA